MALKFAKPENAINRADELIAVGSKAEALDSLRSVVTSRRHKTTWQKSLETLMIKYLDLCVELRKGKEAKDGLHQYRGACQQINIGSLGIVIRSFLLKAEEHAKGAQSKADKIVLDCEDLEADEGPESIMLGQEDTRNRTDREIVTPWLKFLWETYRTVLDILRNNSRLEELYQDTAKAAFDFCKSHKRTTEFRRLCDILRQHIDNLPKYAHQQNAISLTNPVSLNLHLETRFVQLNVACELELWQEAFKSIKDIHGLMSLSKKIPLKTRMMANYYEKLAKIFWVSGNYLFHAYALHKFYTLSRNQNSALSQDELRSMASSVLLAALCIPINAGNNMSTRGLLSRNSAASLLNGMDWEGQDGSQKEKNNTFAGLLGPVGTTPTREALLQELVTRGILTAVVPEMAQLYSLLEEKVHPLEMCNLLKDKLDLIGKKDELKNYTEPLEKVVLIRLLQQLSKVYQTMKIGELSKMVFFVKPHELEKLLVEAVRNRYVDIRIDHQKSVLHFGSQTLDSDKMRNQLSDLSKNLFVVVKKIRESQPGAVPQSEDISGKPKETERLVETLVAEHTRIAIRKKVIERRREIEEQIARVKERASEEASQKAEIQRRKAEEIRKREEEAAREEARKAEIKAKQDKAKVLAMAKHNDIAAQVLKNVDLESTTAEELEKSIKGEISKAKQARENKLLKLAKEMDHFERAKREEEKPLLDKTFAEQQEKEREYYETQRVQYVELQQKQYESQTAERNRLVRMKAFRAAFEEPILTRRKSVYEQKKKVQDEKLVSIREQIEREREQRKVERELRRKEEEERRIKEEERKKEEAQRREEEKLLKAKEEERRLQDIKRREEEIKKRDEEERRRKDEMSTSAPAPATGSGWSRGTRAPASQPSTGSDPWRKTGGPGPARNERRDDRGLDRRDDRGFERRDDRGIERRDDRGFERRDDRGFERRDDRGIERRDDRGFERRDDRGIERRDDRGIERRDDRGIERRDDRGFERRDDRGFERRDDRGLDRRDDRGFERRDDRKPQTFAGRPAERRPDPQPSAASEWRRPQSTSARPSSAAPAPVQSKPDRPKEVKQHQEEKKPEDDGWATVKKGGKKGGK